MYGSEIHETGLPDGEHMNRSKRFAVLAVVAMLSVLSPAHAANLLVSSALVAHPLEHIFVAPVDVGGDFRLVAGDERP
jgi:hypothetical protein